MRPEPAKTTAEFSRRAPSQALADSIAPLERGPPPFRRLTELTEKRVRSRAKARRGSGAGSSSFPSPRQVHEVQHLNLKGAAQACGIGTTQVRVLVRVRPSA